MIDATERFSPEFIRTHLGASQVPAALGLDPYCPPILLWQRFVGLEPWPERTAAMDWGHRLEGIVGAHAAERLGVEVEPGVTCAHPRISWLVATPDFRVRNRPRNVQAKTVGAVTFAHGVKQRWGADGTDEAPLYAVAQVMTEMLVDHANGIPTEGTYVAAWLAGEEPRLYDIPYDDGAAKAIVSQASAFWECVQTSTPPPPDGSEAFHQYLSRTFPASMDGLTIDADDHAEAVARSLIQAKAARKAAEVAEKVARNQIESIMRDAERLRFPGGSVSWKSQLNDAKLQDSFWDEVAWWFVTATIVAAGHAPEPFDPTRPGHKAMLRVAREEIVKLEAKHTARIGTHRVLRTHITKEKK